MRSSINQNFRLFSAILAKVTRPFNAHMLIKYAHVLTCICVGEGSRHFSAISFWRESNLAVYFKNYKFAKIKSLAIFPAIQYIDFIWR